MSTVTESYIGRFAPSPTGPLHSGSLVAAMASYLDAKAHDGRWLVRIEDIDLARNVPGAAEHILQTLRLLGMHWDGDVLIQSQRSEYYAAAMTLLQGHTYPCACSRREIADSQGPPALSAHAGNITEMNAIYPGTCRAGLAVGKRARAWRLAVPEAGRVLNFTDRWQGNVTQDLALATGDFVLLRADGYWAYQLAVVVDDAAQAVTHVVRGLDLLDSTPRQIYLQTLLGLPTPAYMHVPLVTNMLGEKLSKQTGALALDMDKPLSALMMGAQFLGLQLAPSFSIEEFWQSARHAWQHRFGPFS